MSKYSIVKHKDRKTGAKKYVLTTVGGPYDLRLNLYELLDPHGNRGIYRNRQRAWKFNTKQEAEDLLVIAKLKGYL